MLCAMKVLAIFLIISFLSIAVTSNNANNVCTRLIDYLVIDLSPNCYYNPDVGGDISEIVTRYNYPYEEHRVVTEDGYYLNVMRLPQNGPPIFLQHGLFASAGCWLLIGNRSLAFRLYDAGYDVWLGNARGTYFSNEHVNQNITDEEYWNFSWHEMGYYDLPAALDFVANTTQSNEKIIYIGHSMGTTMSYVYSILHKNQAEQRLSALISLAPIANIEHISGAFSLAIPIYRKLETLSRIFRIYSVAYHDSQGRTDFYETCLYQPTSVVCDLFVEFLLEPEPEILPMWITSALQGTALKTLLHYAQIITNHGRFQFFDYENDNVRIYHSNEPPAYNISNIGLPVHLFYGRRDQLATETDVDRFYNELNTTKSIRRIAEQDEVLYNHPDFLSSRQIEYLYDPLFRVLGEIQHGSN